MKQDTSILERLIERDTGGKTFNPEDYTALHEAARLGDIPVIKILLNFGAKVDARSMDNNTPLMMALFWDQVDAAQYLLDRGADLEARGFKGRTALSAVSRSRIVSVKYALDREANIEAKDWDGYTPVMIAACSGRPDIVRLLLARGASTKTRDSKGRAMLHVIAEEPMLRKDEVIDAVLEAKPNLRATDAQGRSPLIAAVEAREPSMVKKLIAREADLEFQDYNGRTALIAAASIYGSVGVELTRLLLDAGANINAKTNNGQTAFEIAKMEDFRRMFENSSRERFTGVMRALYAASVDSKIFD